MSHPHPETQEISLLLDGYDDIFSDFDARNYERRSLSTDFLDEIRRASRDKWFEGIDLVIHVPQGSRDEACEATVRERLMGHFRKHYTLLQTQRRRILWSGISMIFFGIICMILATYVAHYVVAHNVAYTFFLVFLEPAAWFLLWEGMDLVLFGSKSINQELAFYKKMAHTRGHIHFVELKPTS